MRKRCPEGSRWICSQYADWEDRDGLGPWGEFESTRQLLGYLASMTAEEHESLAAIAFENLNTGYWEGCKTANGGWEDGEPWSQEEAMWRASAREFVERWLAGERTLTEGLIRFGTYDLGRELAWLRGWCRVSGLWQSFA